MNMSRITCERCISYDTARKMYYLYMDLGKDGTGRRLRRYRTYPSLAAARKAQAEFWQRRTQLKRPAPEELTLDAWLERWMREVVIPNRAETTTYGYQKIIDNHLSPMLGSIPLNALSPRDLQSYYAYLMEEKGLSANTVRRHHDLLSAALHAAQRQDLIPRAPTERAEPPHVVQREAKYYDQETLKRLFRLVDDHWLKVVVHLAGSLGLRREEICGLRWESVDFQLRRLHIRAARTAAGAKVIEKGTKNDSSSRVLYMGDDIYDLLLAERRRQMERPGWTEHSLVAVDREGRPFSPNMLSLSFTKFIRDHQLPPLTLHGLRHSFATVACAQGAPLFDIGKALGHSTPATTGRIYTHLVDQLHMDTLDKVARALK